MVQLGVCTKPAGYLAGMSLDLFTGEWQFTQPPLWLNSHTYKSERLGIFFSTTDDNFYAQPNLLARYIANLETAYDTLCRVAYLESDGIIKDTFWSLKDAFLKMARDSVKDVVPPINGMGDPNIDRPRVDFPTLYNPANGYRLHWTESGEWLEWFNTPLNSRKIGTVFGWDVYYSTDAKDFTIDGQVIVNALGKLMDIIVPLIDKRDDRLLVKASPMIEVKTKVATPEPVVKQPEYIPNPVDTRSVRLPKELVDLTERIAENVHDVWAKGRIAEGWTYGDVKDAALKKTPCLVPYNDLPESEKEYDRNTAFETVKLIIKLGYNITAPAKSEVKSNRPSITIQVEDKKNKLRSAVVYDLVSKEWVSTHRDYDTRGEENKRLGLNVSVSTDTVAFTSSMLRDLFSSLPSAYETLCGAFKVDATEYLQGTFLGSWEDFESTCFDVPKREPNLEDTDNAFESLPIDTELGALCWNGVNWCRCPREELTSWASVLDKSQLQKMIASMLSLLITNPDKTLANSGSLEAIV